MDLLMFLLVKFFRSLELSPEHALIVQPPHGNGSPSHEIRKLPHVLIRCDHTVCHHGKSFFPAGCQCRIQKRSYGIRYHIVDHLSHLGRRQYLGLFIQCQILDVHQFLQDLRSRSAGADTTSLDLCPQFLIFYELSRIFHGQDDAA